MPAKLAPLLLGLALLLRPGAAGGAQALPDYQDDRSTAQSVMQSYVNAVNRQEYLRAYSYWEPGSPELPGFDAFAQGYATTASVSISEGDARMDVGAGQLYWRLPVTLVATMTDGSTQTFVGCYQLHLSRPQLQAVPPFKPMGIQRASVSQVDNDADTAALMQTACAF
jgi:hypothetical protein